MVFKELVVVVLFEFNNNLLPIITAVTMSTHWLLIKLVCFLLRVVGEHRNSATDAELEARLISRMIPKLPRDRQIIVGLEAIENNQENRAALRDYVGSGERNNAKKFNEVKAQVRLVCCAWVGCHLTP